jgi:predicted histidine transporter YuiF (NhaC family)
MATKAMPGMLAVAKADMASNLPPVHIVTIPMSIPLRFLCANVRRQDRELASVSWTPLFG